MADFVVVADLESVKEGEAKLVTAGGEEIALFRLGEQIHALRNFCPHLGGPIAEGIIRDNTVTCPWHDWTFEIESGECTFNPAACIRRYPVKVVGNQIQVEV